MEAPDIAHRALRYLTTPAVVGFEDAFVSLLHDELVAMGCQVERRPTLLAAVGGPDSLSVHVDRHGFVTGEHGRLRYAATELSNRPMPPNLATAICQRSTDEVVYAYEPRDGSVRAEATITHAAHCGLGPDLDLVVAAFAAVAPGSPVAFKTAGTLEDGWLRGQIDNTICVALAMELLAGGFDGTVLFTQGEEAGRSWQALASWYDSPTSDLIVLDTSPFDGPGPASAGMVVLRGADAGAAFDAETTARLAHHADIAGVPVVWKDQRLAEDGKPLGRTELGHVISETRGRVTGSTLQIPTTEYHTNHESTTLTAIQSASKVLSELYLA